VVKSEIFDYNGCPNPCTNPVITYIAAQANVGFTINYTLPSNCNGCTLFVLNTTNTIINSFPGICGSNSILFNTTDTCTKYKFVIRCDTRECGLLYSDTARNAGCGVPPPNCTNPVITNLQVNNTTHSYTVSYTLTPNCDSCKIYMYNAADTMVVYVVQIVLHLPH
jgi:hypothetical protein